MRLPSSFTHGLAALLPLAFGLGVSTGAVAQGFLELEQTPTFIGLGVGTVPDYKGSDDTIAGAAPYARHTFAGQRYVQLFANELTVNVLDSARYRFGPVVNYHFGRDSDVEDSVVKRMGEISGTVELGLFGDIAWIDASNPRNRLIMGGMLLQDAGGESDGLRARLSVRYWQQVHQAVDVHLGAGLIYADEKYNDHYFGVDAANVGTSALPMFEADGGANEYFVNLGAAFYLSRQWVVGAGVRYGHIAGDAADSPVVSQRGSDSQVTAGIGLAYILWP